MEAINQQPQTTPSSQTAAIPHFSWRILRNISLGAFFGSLIILFFALSYPPHFAGVHNFLTQPFGSAYRQIIWYDLALLLLSSAYIFYSLFKAPLEGYFAPMFLTSFFIGATIPLLIINPLYAQITAASLHPLSMMGICFAAFLLDIVVIMTIGGTDHKSKGEMNFVTLFMGSCLIVVSSFMLHHKDKDLTQNLSTAYYEARYFPAPLSYQMNWHQVNSHEVRTDLHNLGGDGAVIASRIYREANYKMPVVVWDNVLNLGRYINRLQNHGLLTGGVPSHVVPRPRSLKKILHLAPYYQFFTHPSFNFYINHYGLHDKYRAIQQLHQGDYFTRHLASLKKIELVNSQIGSYYEYQISRALGTGKISKYYKSFEHQYQNWQNCVAQEGKSYCTTLRPHKPCIYNPS